MNLFGLAALSLAVIAVLLLAFGAGDSWFFGLLAMALLLQGAREAYQEHRATTLLCLIGGAFFAGASFRSLLRRHTAPGGGT